MQSLAGRLLVLCLLLLVLITGIRIFHAWRNDPYLNIAAGSLVAMAADLRDGVFYRPLLAPDGSYGGTRYLPLYWAPIGLLMKLGVPALVAGYGASFLSAALLLAGLYFLLFELGVGRAFSACGALLLLSSEALQYLLITIRADALATGLGVWGVFFCLAGSRRRWYFLAAAACFSLAFAAKATTDFALGAAVISAFLAGKKREAWTTSAATILGFLAVMGIMYVGSAGRALEVIRQCASAGYPPLGIRQGTELFLRTMWVKDQGGFLLFFLALATLATVPARTWKEVPAVLFILSLGGMLFIFSYLSQDFNHLLDLDVASIVLVISTFATAGAHEEAHRPSSDALKFRIALLALVVALSVGWTFNRLGHPERPPKRRDWIEATRRLEGVRGPILAENPLVPIFLRQKVYMSDPFMFGALRRKSAGFSDPLLKKVREREFGAIVLAHDPKTEEGREFLGTVLFGEDFLKSLDEYYFLSARVGDNLIYLPLSSPISCDKAGLPVDVLRHTRMRKPA